MNKNAPAFILAAGRGERMRPLTDHTPKPLLKVQGKPLLQWHIDALQQAGCTHVVANTAWLGQQMPPFFKQAASTMHWQLSEEQNDFGHALETAGGIVRALPLIQQAIFWVVAGDVFTPQFTFNAQAVQRFAQAHAQKGTLAHLWLVPNPAHNPKGDFGIDSDGFAINRPVNSKQEERYTYSTIGLYHAALFTQPWCDIPHGNPQGISAPLAPLLRKAIDAQRVSAELYEGAWTDVGTPDRLIQLNT